MRPFGFEADRRTIRESEAQVLRAAAAQLLEGTSLNAVLKALEEAGVRAVSGKRFDRGVLRRALLSDRVAGLMAGPEGPMGAPWEPIVDRETHARLVEVLTDPARRTYTEHDPARRTYLLTGGLARCGLCGEPLIARPMKAQERAYVCSSTGASRGCGRIRIDAELLEGVVIAALGNELAHIEAPTHDPEWVEAAHKVALAHIETVWVDPAITRGSKIFNPDRVRIERARAARGVTAG